MILKSIDDDDWSLCKSFYPDMFDSKTSQGQTYTTVKTMYEEGVKQFGNEYDYYNHIEK